MNNSREILDVSIERQYFTSDFSNLILTSQYLFMIIRIVRMHFTEAGVEEFLDLFNQNKEAIRNFPGCLHLQLLKDSEDFYCYTTLSHWDGPLSLENYRKSELFGKVWGRVKTLFSERTQAFSLEKFIEL